MRESPGLSAGSNFALFVQILGVRSALRPGNDFVIGDLGVAVARTIGAFQKEG